MRAWLFLVAALLPSRGMALLHLPNEIKTVIVNIGSNLDPLLPPEDDPTVAAIAFEPIVSCNISHHPRLYVVPAAVSSEDGMALMNVAHQHGVSSSLYEPTKKVHAMLSANTGVAETEKIVPMVAMTTFLNSIPERIDILHIKTDMQGHDYSALSSAGALLRRAHYLETEVYFRGVETYKGAKNDFCRDTFPFMRSIGFEVIGVYNRHKYSDSLHKSNLKHGIATDAASADAFCKRETLKGAVSVSLYEGNAYWKRNDTTLQPPQALRRDI